ncbi:MAG: SgcJ/EcaC family oxidoreductase, partial [Pseudobdellovibrionaceae bacterium]
MTSNFSEEDKVRALYKKLLDQWNEQKAQGMANLFTENGSMVGFDGTQINGAKEIEAHLN